MAKQGKQKESTYAEFLRQAEKLGREDANKIRPILEKDPDWLLASGKQKLATEEERKREKRALVRLTKKAVNLLFPQYKTLCHRGTGTAHQWVCVNILVKKQSAEDLFYEEIKRRANMMLEVLGLCYGKYFSDSLPGKDEYTSCLSVSIND